MAEPLAPFDDSVIEVVAAETGVAVEDLRDLLRRQQRLVRDFPDMTVEALVHDWRTALPEDPLIERDDLAYYLSVREHVWRDLVGRLDLSHPEASALRAANDRQFRETLGVEADREAAVLTR